MDWSYRQEEILREHGHEGVEAVQRAIARQCGVTHSIRAIEAHASRIHVSLRRLTKCPECGVLGPRLNKHTGLCPLCSERQHVEEERAFNAILREELKGVEDSPELAKLKREYAALRKANSRMCKKHGLLPKSKREQGDS